MAWIESHQALRDHPKVRHLARLLSVDLDSSLGKLHRFWWWCTDYAEDGDLRKHGMDVISDSLAYNSRTLIHSHWVDTEPYLRVHDWWDWSGRYWQSKYKNVPEKWQRIKSLYQVGIKSVLLTGHIPTDLPTDIPTIPPGGFELLWNKYPRREGKKAAVKHFDASVKTRQDWLDIQSAMENYIKKLQREKTEPQFIKMGSTWFFNWRDYVDYKAAEVPKIITPPKKIEPPPKPEDLVSHEDVKTLAANIGKRIPRA